MGYLFVISGPSAVGKTTVVECLLERSRQISRVITCTTRNIRNGEQDGVDYIFLSKNEFLRKVNNNEFVEFSEVYGNNYGVLLKSIKDSMENHIASILTINWEGYLKIKEAIKKNVIGIFINPPSLKELENRIRGRGSDDEETIKKRLDAAQLDMSFAKKYDFVIENHEIQRTSDDIFEIISKITKK